MIEKFKKDNQLRSETVRVKEVRPDVSEDILHRYLVSNSWLLGFHAQKLTNGFRNPFTLYPLYPVPKYQDMYPLTCGVSPLRACLFLTSGPPSLLPYYVGVLEICGSNLSLLNKDPLAFTLKTGSLVSLGILRHKHNIMLLSLNKTKGAAKTAH